MPITVVIDDPATIQLLAKYRQFIAQEDFVEGTLDQAAEGLLLGCLDEHHRFNTWCKNQPDGSCDPKQNSTELAVIHPLFAPPRLAYSR